MATPGDNAHARKLDAVQSCVSLGEHTLTLTHTHTHTHTQVHARKLERLLTRPLRPGDVVGCYISLPALEGEPPPRIYPVPQVCWSAQRGREREGETERETERERERERDATTQPKTYATTQPKTYRCSLRLLVLTR
jgi:hypothetical protein